MNKISKKIIFMLCVAIIASAATIFFPDELGSALTFLVGWFSAIEYRKIK